jgi:nitrous oxidase accessory protein NosD
MICALRRLIVASELVGLMVVPRLAQAQGVATIELRQGLVITKSARVSPKDYRLPAANAGDSSVITIRGDNITLDFAGATMEGAPPDADPDVAAGVAIRIDGGRNVRIANARIRGYKIGILARGTRGVSLIDNNLSNNWKPRLYSIVEHESLIDWLSFHHNEKDEWLRYGAGIYLADVSGGEISGNTVEQGMNGLMLVRSNGLRIISNSFSFNSGVGIGLYRSSGDTIMHNHVDYDVRGYSEGFYRRGQDAADLLIYEQSSNNVVAYNSMTHGGDGVFLWAGQSTMDTGQGGANDNYFYGNDFSFAPANGIEATFSRNIFIANRIEGCEYGVWGGYSFDSRFMGNHFLRNRTGIAIEHGQNNVIATNTFSHDSTAIRVWGDPIEPSDWGYPRHRDTRSRDYSIERNLFEANRVGLRAAATTGLAVRKNKFAAVDSVIVVRDSSKYVMDGNVLNTGEPLTVSEDYSAYAPPPVRGGFTPLTVTTRTAAQLPRSAIIVDEWGPFDWRSPKLWPIDSTRALPLRLRVLGPPGRWRVVSTRGLAAVTPQRGRALDTVVVTPKRDSIGNWELVLEYVGGATLSPSGQRKAAGIPYRFAYSRFEPPIDWSTRFFKWNDTISDLRKNPPSETAFASLTQVLAQRSTRVDLEGYRAFNPQVPREYFAAEATGSVDLAPGEYTLRTISDDGVRVWVDGALVIDNWKPHESALDFAPLKGGHHDLRVQYYQADGWYEIRLDIIKGKR